jgi:cell division protein FtsL
MAEHHHHHHHHQTHQDGATMFKLKSLKAIQRRKMIEKVLKAIVTVIAILMGIAVVIVYTI